MNEYRLGDDISLSFLVLVGGHRRAPMFESGTLFRETKKLGEFNVSHKENRVIGSIPNVMIHVVGEYTAEFVVRLLDIGEVKHAIDFKVIPSEMGKRRQ